MIDSIVTTLIIVSIYWMSTHMVPFEPIGFFAWLAMIAWLNYLLLRNTPQRGLA